MVNALFDEPFTVVDALAVEEYLDDEVMNSLWVVLVLNAFCASGVW